MGCGLQVTAGEPHSRHWHKKLSLRALPAKLKAWILAKRLPGSAANANLAAMPCAAATQSENRPQRVVARSARDSSPLPGNPSTWSNRGLWWSEKGSPGDVGLLRRCKLALGQEAVQKTEGRPAAVVARRRLLQLGFDSQHQVGRPPPLVVPNDGGNLASPSVRNAMNDSCSADARDPGLSWRTQSFTVLSDGAGPANKPLLFSVHSVHDETQNSAELPTTPVDVTNIGKPLMLEAQTTLAALKPSSQSSTTLLERTALANLPSHKGLLIDPVMWARSEQGGMEAFMRNVHSQEIQLRGPRLAEVHRQRAQSGGASMHLLHAWPWPQTPLQNVRILVRSSLRYTNASFPRSCMPSTVCPAVSGRNLIGSHRSPPGPVPSRVPVRTRIETSGVPSTRGLELRALHLPSQQSAFTLSALQLSPMVPAPLLCPRSSGGEPSIHHKISCSQAAESVLPYCTDGGSVDPLLGNAITGGCSTCLHGHASLAGGDAGPLLLREPHPEPPLSTSDCPHAPPLTGFRGWAHSDLQPRFLCHNTGFDLASAHHGEPDSSASSDGFTGDTLYPNTGTVEGPATSKAAFSSSSAWPRASSLEAMQSDMQQPHQHPGFQKTADLGPVNPTPPSTAMGSDPGSHEGVLSPTLQRGGSQRARPSETCQRASHESRQEEEQACPMVDQGNDALFQERVPAHARQDAMQPEEAYSSENLTGGGRHSADASTMLDMENDTRRYPL